MSSDEPLITFKEAVLEHNNYGNEFYYAFLEDLHEQARLVRKEYPAEWEQFVPTFDNLIEDIAKLRDFHKQEASKP